MAGRFKKITVRGRCHYGMLSVQVAWTLKQARTSNNEGSSSRMHAAMGSMTIHTEVPGLLLRDCDLAHNTQLQ